MKRACQRQRGFTLLEAIVALVLLTTAGLALFSWINAGFDSLQRIERANRLAAAEINALEFMRNINVMDKPEGRASLGNVEMRWRATQVTAPRPNVGDTREASVFVVALYDTQIVLDAPPQIENHVFVVRQMGFSRGADPNDGVANSTPSRTNGRPPGAAARR
jgi:general secretion pathway protein I